mmetsp:Transcript_157495/g.277850  ORF Transcript_157495/g.277850 Transcript_157495/m.277850 type:complete len:206 (-) Transcript_157495:66-683(-)
MTRPDQRQSKQILQKKMLARTLEEKPGLSQAMDLEAELQRLKAEGAAIAEQRRLGAEQLQNLRRPDAALEARHQESLRNARAETLQQIRASEAQLRQLDYQSDLLRGRHQTSEAAWGEFQLRDDWTWHWLVSMRLRELQEQHAVRTLYADWESLVSAQLCVERMERSRLYNQHMETCLMAAHRDSEALRLRQRRLGLDPFDARDL